MSVPIWFLSRINVLFYSISFVKLVIILFLLTYVDFCTRKFNFGVIFTIISCFHVYFFFTDILCMVYGIQRKHWMLMFFFFFFWCKSKSMHGKCCNDWVFDFYDYFCSFVSLNALVVGFFWYMFFTLCRCSRFEGIMCVLTTLCTFSKRVGIWIFERTFVSLINVSNWCRRIFLDFWIYIHCSSYFTCLEFELHVKMGYGVFLVLTGLQF